MPGQVERLGHLDAGVAERAEQPAHEALLEVGGDVVDEAAEAVLDAADQVAQEADRVGDDVADHVRGLGQDVQQHVLELQDRLDHADDGVERLVDQALVGRLELLDPRVQRVARRRRTSARACRPARPACCRRRWRAGPTARRACPRRPCRPSAGLRELRDVVVDLGAAGGDLHARRVELVADEVGDLADHRVHRRQVAGAAVRVEALTSSGMPKSLSLSQRAPPQKPL